MLNDSDLHIIRTRTAKGKTKGKHELTAIFKQINERRKIVFNF